ncbi:hypothetical protein [Mesobacterium pallidum]|uniref:hypothetical protein n=1 Tax=Mesobacterium pallidum TaxID=2872037 RepID=UPI001EE23896|nr:hypothetical protein [Mesobacterium pallidum]
MPSAFHMFPEDNFVISLHWGVMTAREHSALIQEYRRHPEAHPMQDCLVDFTHVTDYEITFSTLLFEISSLQLPDVRPDLSRMAILAPTDVGYGVARMYESVIDGRLSTTPRVFQTRPEAFSWLRRDDGPRYRLTPPLP